VEESYSIMDEGWSKRLSIFLEYRSDKVPMTAPSCRQMVTTVTLPFELSNDRIADNGVSLGPILRLQKYRPISFIQFDLDQLLRNRNQRPTSLHDDGEST
jgi:hypothetical protein